MKLLLIGFYIIFSGNTLANIVVTDDSCISRIEQKCSNENRLTGPTCQVRVTLYYPEDKEAIYFVENFVTKRNPVNRIFDFFSKESSLGNAISESGFYINSLTQNYGTCSVYRFANVDEWIED